MNHPELVENQPESVFQDCAKTRTEFIKYRETNLTKRQVITLTNYSVADGWRYDWNWVRYRQGEGDEDRVELENWIAARKKELLAGIGVKI